MKITIAVAPGSIALRAVGERQFITLEPYEMGFYLEGFPDPQAVRVPQDFKTDLGSVPWLARWVVSVAAAPIPFVVHDYLCRESVTRADRRLADLVMVALMRHTGTPGNPLVRYVAFAGVRIGAIFAKKSPYRD